MTRLAGFRSNGSPLSGSALLPERQRLVVVGYFLEGRTSQDLARFLGVTESRVSQLRSEALLMLKEGIESQYDPDGQEALEDVTGRVARRKVGYANAIGERSAWKDRMERINLVEADAGKIPVGLPLS